MANDPAVSAITPEPERHSTREIVVDFTGVASIIPLGHRRFGHNPSWVKASDYDALRAALLSSDRAVQLDVPLRQILASLKKHEGKIRSRQAAEFIEAAFQQGMAASDRAVKEPDHD